MPHPSVHDGWVDRLPRQAFRPRGLLAPYCQDWRNSRQAAASGVTVTAKSK